MQVEWYARVGNISRLQMTPTRWVVDHCELAVAHIFRVAETCKYLGVIGDAHRDDPAGKRQILRKGMCR